MDTDTDRSLIHKKILIAEDEPAMLNALRDKFAREGCEVITAEDGEVALSLAATERPDMILLDILMPKVDGMEVLSKIRGASEWGKKVPVIILTNLPADERIMGGIVKDEPSYYLVKSDWKLYEVVEKVRSCFKAPAST
ncbi:MAG: response regulator [Candidatus Pacebacteria bacterium]|nr:response regulator [Candidatus Paceibacterota bacterium]